MKTKGKRNRSEDKADEIEEIPEEVKNGEDKRKTWMGIIGGVRRCPSIQVEEIYELQELSGTNMADKIEEIPEEGKNGAEKFQEKPRAAKKPKKNRFLARLRKTWTRFIGYVTCCTSIQVEEIYKLQELSGTNMADKIEEIPEEGNYGEDKFWEKPRAAKKPKKNRFLAPLRKPWMGIIGDVRCCTSIQGEEIYELQELSGTNMADKIEEIPEEGKNGEDKFWEKPRAAKKPKKNRFLAPLRKPWMGIIGDVRCCTSIQVEEIYELQELSGTNMADKIEEIPEEGKNGEDKFWEKPRAAKKPKKNRFLAPLRQTWTRFIGYVRCYPSIQVEEIYELQELSGTNMADSKGFRSPDASCEAPGPSPISRGGRTSGAASSKGKEEEDDKRESNIVNINDEREDFTSEEASSNSSSLEQILEELSDSDSCTRVDAVLEELYKSIITSQGGSGDDTSDSCSLEEEALQELSDSDSCTRVDAILEELFKSIITSQGGSGDDTSDPCSLEEEALQELSDSDSCTRVDAILEELFKSIITSQEGSGDDTSDPCSLEEEAPQEFFKYSKSPESCTNYEESTSSDLCLEEPNQNAKETSGTVPLSLNSFTFHQELGTEGYRKVYLAKDVIRKECVAIKASHKYYVLRDYRFTERHILQRSHENPYLIHCFGAFHTENFVYYVTESTTGVNLEQFINMNFPLDTATIQFITAEIICGTQFLHKNGIIHRDLTPANIYLTAEGHIKISNFGLAIKDVYEMTRKPGIGTPGYAAPEQLKCLEYGHGVDFFAIGVILYRLYNLKSPFNAEDHKDIDLAVLIDTPLYQKTLTQDTVDILKGLLQKDPLKRLGVNGDIKNHQYFKDMIWEDVEARRVTPPAIMTAMPVNLDVSYTLPYDEPPNNKSIQYQKIFNEFSFVCAEWAQHYHPVIIETEY